MTVLHEVLIKRLLRMNAKSFTIAVRDAETFLSPTPVILRLGVRNYVVFKPKPCGLFRIKYHYVSDSSFDNFIKAQYFLRTKYTPESYLYINDDGCRAYLVDNDAKNLSGMCFRRVL